MCLSAPDILTQQDPTFVTHQMEMCTQALAGPLDWGSPLSCFYNWRKASLAYKAESCQVLLNTLASPLLHRRVLVTGGQENSNWKVVEVGICHLTCPVYKNSAAFMPWYPQNRFSCTYMLQKGKTEKPLAVLFSIDWWILHKTSSFDL